MIRGKAAAKTGLEGAAVESKSSNEKEDEKELDSVHHEEIVNV